MKINLRGIDFRDEKKKRIPIYVKYDSFIVNDEDVLNDSVIVWHDKPYNFEKDVEDGEIVDLVVHWSAV